MTSVDIGGLKVASLTSLPHCRDDCISSIQDHRLVPLKQHALELWPPPALRSLALAFTRARH